MVESISYARMDVRDMTAAQLVDELLARSKKAQKAAVCELRLRTKQDDDRVSIANAGAIPLVAAYLTSAESDVQENAVTALLNLSILPHCKREIVGNSVCLDGIIVALKSGKSEETKQNASATLFSLLVLEELREYVGSKNDVILALLNLLQSDLANSRKEAIKALFHLCLCQANKARVVRAGAVPHLVSIGSRERVSTAKTKWTADLPLENSRDHKRDNIVEDTLAVLALLAGCTEGVAALMDASAVPLLVELLEPQRHPRCRENATSALLAMVQTGGDEVVQEVLKCKFCISALCGVLSSGSCRARGKAGSLLQILIANEEL